MQELQAETSKRLTPSPNPNPVINFVADSDTEPEWPAVDLEKPPRAPAMLPMDEQESGQETMNAPSGHKVPAPAPPPPPPTLPTPWIDEHAEPPPTVAALEHPYESGLSGSHSAGASVSASVYDEPVMQQQQLQKPASQQLPPCLESPPTQRESAGVVSFESPCVQSPQHQPPAPPPVRYCNGEMPISSMPGVMPSQQQINNGYVEPPPPPQQQQQQSQQQQINPDYASVSRDTQQQQQQVPVPVQQTPVENHRRRDRSSSGHHSSHSSKKSTSLNNSGHRQQQQYPMSQKSDSGSSNANLPASSTSSMDKYGTGGSFQQGIAPMAAAYGAMPMYGAANAYAASAGAAWYGAYAKPSQPDMAYVNPYTAYRPTAGSGSFPATAGHPANAGFNSAASQNHAYFNSNFAASAAAQRNWFSSGLDQFGLQNTAAAAGTFSGGNGTNPAAAHNFAPERFAFYPQPSTYFPATPYFPFNMK